VLISAMFSMNALAEASQVWLAANSRQACGEIRKLARHASRKSSFNAPTGAEPSTSRGPVTGKAATGTPLASLQISPQACLEFAASHTWEASARAFIENMADISTVEPIRDAVPFSAEHPRFVA